MNTDSVHLPRVTTESDVGLEVRNNAGLAIFSLLSDCLEEEVHRLPETLLHARSRGDNCPPPETSRK